jgi:hypothetical protein
MTLPRREFLATGAAAITTLAQSVIPTPAQAQAPVRAALPKRSARDRLEEALARIAAPNGEGKRACLTVYSDAARAAADAADARVRAGVSLGPLAAIASPEPWGAHWRVFLSERPSDTAEAVGSPVRPTDQAKRKRCSK